MLIARSSRLPTIVSISLVCSFLACSDSDEANPTSIQNGGTNSGASGGTTGTGATSANAGASGSGNAGTNTSGSAGDGGSPQGGSAGQTAGTSGSGGLSGSAGSGGSQPSITFGVCNEGYQTECAIFQAPLNHEEPEGEQIDIHISRIPASQSSDRQLWLLAGGPGQGGNVFYNIAAKMAEKLPTTDIYVIDHRGTGYSHRLTCPQQDTPDSYGGYSLQPSDVPACLEALKTTGDYDRLAYFTSKQAALDLKLAISKTQTDGQKVFVWGGSYGTHWAHRFLQVAPDLAAGVIFDGYMTPNHFSFTHYDHGVEEAAEQFAQACQSDANCAAKVGNQPLQYAKQVIDNLAITPCGQFSRSLSRTWGSIFMDGFYSHGFVFPFLHRLERCNPQDKTALLTLVQNYYDALTGGAPQLYLSSGILQYNIVLSELWSLPGEGDTTAQQLEESADQQLFLSGSSYPGSIISLRDFWPLPPADYDDLPLPVSPTPSLLWLAGTLDTRTPLTQANQIDSLYHAENQHKVVIPGAVHTPSLGSPKQSNTSETCGLDIVAHFVQTNGEITTDCFSDLYPTLFESPSDDFSQQWWGVADEWGDGPEPPPTENTGFAKREYLPPTHLSPSQALTLQQMVRTGIIKPSKMP